MRTKEDLPEDLGVESDLKYFPSHPYDSSEKRGEEMRAGEKFRTVHFFRPWREQKVRVER